MKTNSVRMAILAVVAVTMAVPAFAGQARTARVISPDSQDWQYREALETGNLPSDQAVLKGAMSPAKDVPAVENGGIVFRVGIDTP